MADTTPPQTEVVAQEAKTVGDDNLKVREPDTQVNAEQVAAQVAQPREGDADKVNVHETSVTTDTVITDTSDPLAVQVPDAGRGSLDLPIHALSGPVVEDVFDVAAKDEKPASRRRKSADSSE
jgi:hypothetical protein